MAKTIVVDENDCTGQDEWWCYWYKCKKCGENKITNSFKYCPMCGSKLKFETK
jgi:rRNA maturation endonuclease Nob1